MTVEHNIESDGIIAVLKLLTGKWKMPILFCLSCGDTKRFNELRKAMPEVSQRMLTKQLRELERDHIINRKVYAEVPPKVEYSLTDIGVHLKPILASLQKWGKCYLIKQEAGWKK